MSMQIIAVTSAREDKGLPGVTVRYLPRKQGEP